MNNLKKILGFFWLILAVLVGYFGFSEFGIQKINSPKQEDFIFGIIIIFILLPIIVGGLGIFGWYALKGEYNDENKN